MRIRLPALVAALLLIFTARASVQSRSFDLLTASVGEIQAAVAAGALTYERLVTLCLARIDAYDKKGPRLNAVIEINPRALETARALDAERRRSGVQPLHGIPIAVKDNLDVSDIPSAGGNPALAGTFRRATHGDPAPSRRRRDHLPQDQHGRTGPRQPGGSVHLAARF